MSYGFDNIVGVSQSISKLKETARRIAPTDITVLISGPSGTGKELFARAIHHHSKRRHGPMVAVDCTAIPEALLESELFGHRKGAFTSAWRDKKGLFEEADGGTVFLDEVSNLSLAAQAKLLRFLQDSEIRPVGDSVSRKVDVRIVAACNRDLGEMVRAGEFREDLFYRLSVIPLHLPPLVERNGDVEVLAHYFLRRIAADLNLEHLTATREAIDKLCRHNWPGNVRELENTLKRASALCSGNVIHESDTVFIVSGSEKAHPDSAAPVKEQEESATNRLDDNQRTVITRALDDNNWNFTQTAQELGIGRTTLWRKVKKFKLKRGFESSLDEEVEKTTDETSN